MNHTSSWKYLSLAGLCGTAILAADIALADITMEYGANVRYRYEHFDRDEDATTPPGATSKASTVRLGVFAKAKLNENLSAFVDLEAVEQLFEDDYNIPTIPGQTIPGYPVIADPQGTEVNQAYVAYNNAAYNTQVRIGRQEVMLNNGRFISTSGWRQNHQSFNAGTASVSPLDNLKLDYGYLARVQRVVGSEASNGRADMDSHFFNIAYSIPDIGIVKGYGVLLDFDDELTNSADTFGLRFEGNMPLGTMRLLSTLEYATQTEAGDNPNDIDAQYLLLEAGLQISNIAYRLGYNIVGADSATDKFITPLAHPFNGWTELFLNNPSLGADNHGLEVWYASATGKVPGTEQLTFTTALYDYNADTGSASYGNGLDLGLEYRGVANTLLGWRFGLYDADELFSDALRTSLYAAYTF